MNYWILRDEQHELRALVCSKHVVPIDVVRTQADYALHPEVVESIFTQDGFFEIPEWETWFAFGFVPAFEIYPWYGWQWRRIKP